MIAGIWVCRNINITLNNMHRHHPDWSSHIPVLIKVMEATSGPVLELGMGIFSTPLLHMLCFDKNRNLVSYDNNQKYVDMFRKYRSETHKIGVVNDWDKIDVDEYNWSVVLVDHTPGERRAVEIARLINAEYLVVHDTEPKENYTYSFDKIYPLFKYKFDYTKAKTHTTVLSNLREFKWEL